MGIDMVDLSDDILENIFKELHPKDLLNVRQTCKRLGRLSRSKVIWAENLRRSLRSQQLVIPQYCRPIETLSGPDCEVIVSRSIQLRRNLADSSTRLPPLIAAINGTRSITWTRLVQGRWLLVASSDQTSSQLSLWSVPALFAESPAKSPIYEAFLEGPVNNGFVEVQEGRIIIALELRPLLRDLVVVLTVMEVGGRKVFGSLARHEGVSCLRALQGSTLAFALHKQRSVPSLLNWPTGEVVNLLPTPDVLGGAVAMAISEHTVAVVSPRRLRVFILQDDHMWALAQTIDISHSIGYAAIQFLPPRVDPKAKPKAEVFTNLPTELRMAIAGQDGLFLYRITRPLDATASFQASLVWDHTPGEREYAHYPVFGQGCESLSWIEGSVASIPELSFLTIRCDFETQADAFHPTVLELGRSHMPAMYGMGVFDYDGVLGIAVFGNIFGDLVVVDLSGANVEAVTDCFEDLQFEALHCDAVSDTPVPVTFHPPFPYLGGRKYPESIHDQFLDYWKSFPEYPSLAPKGWYTDDASDAETWLHYIPILPEGPWDKAWVFEHARHIYGIMIPLAQAHNLSVCHAGGLLYIFFDVEDEVYAAQPGMSVNDFIASLNPELDYPQAFRSATECPHQDFAASTWGYMCRGTWDWERVIRGRDRWEEMRQRGAQIHPSLVEVSASMDAALRDSYRLRLASALSTA